MMVPEEEPPSKSNGFVNLIRDAHQSSGCTLRDVGARTGLNFSYISQIINKQRRPSRDTLILLCTYGWNLELEVTDQLLESCRYKPLSLKRP